MAELLKVREITVDTMQYKDFATKEEELKVMRFYQNDLNSAKLLINVTHDKVVTDFSTATKVQIAFLKPDGKRVFQDVQNVNQMQGKYYVVLSTQTLIAYGNVVTQLRLTFPNNKVIETCKFVFAVDESIMSDTALESTNEFPVIQKAIEVGEKFKDVDFAPIIKAGELAAGALPKAGGTMTGPLTLSGVMSYLMIDDKGGSIRVHQPTDVSTSARGLQYYEGGATVAGVGRLRNGAGIDQMYIGWGTNPWSDTTSLTVSDYKFTYKGKPVAMRDKDGRVTLTLTSDAVNFSANRPLIADRRGNTVTVRGAVGLNSTAVGNVISTLPTDVRPTTDIPMTMLATDGTFLAGDIMQDGRINFWTKGKNVYLSFTYVVD
ncbi:BppU family phage baseplate upper protein [Bacillus sp. H1m]|uniref:BppU family phage baseplate upper protein n=1 Tax=Bacillus sp. H1m TaxID=1397277 RepID=UPI00046AC784|nr:BppU family phage baseplate upper protein [Bacillus sp. H1m]